MMMGALDLCAQDGPELVGLAVVVQAVEGHLEDLVGLAQAIPRTVVPLVHLDGVSVGRGGEIHLIA